MTNGQKAPTWEVPNPYGDVAAIKSMGGIAAPLLAGFSITLAALILSAPQHFRWTSVTLTLLTGAAVALIGALQFTFRALQFAVSPSEIEQWWTDASEAPRREALQREQREHFRTYNTWANRESLKHLNDAVRYLLSEISLLRRLLRRILRDRLGSCRHLVYASSAGSSGISFEASVGRILLDR